MDLSVHKRLHFELVNDENRKEVEGLTVFSEQAGFIESVNECLQEADELELWRPVGIYDSDTLIGFAMYGYFPEPTPGQLWLDRLLIDKKYQGKGYGKQAVELALRFIRTFPWTDCTQSIKAILYILVCMKTIPMQSGFISRSAFASTGSTIPKENISWNITSKNTYNQFFSPDKH